MKNRMKMYKSIIMGMIVMFVMALSLSPPIVAENLDFTELEIVEFEKEVSFADFEAVLARDYVIPVNRQRTNISEDISDVIRTLFSDQELIVNLVNKQTIERDFKSSTLFIINISNSYEQILNYKNNQNRDTAQVLSFGEGREVGDLSYCKIVNFLLYLT